MSDRRRLRRDGLIQPYPLEWSLRSSATYFVRVRVEDVEGGGEPRGVDPLFETASRLLPQVLQDGKGLELLFVREEGEPEKMPAWTDLAPYPRWTGRLSDPRIRAGSRVSRPRIDPLRG